jgi:hypothetical protein
MWVPEETMGIVQVGTPVDITGAAAVIVTVEAAVVPLIYVHRAL